MRYRWIWFAIGLLLGTTAMAVSSGAPSAYSLAPATSPTPLPPTVDTAGKPEYWLVGGVFNCSPVECLFANEHSPNYPVGIASITGYYEQGEITNYMGEGFNVICDYFTVTDGSPEFIRSVNALIDAGNGRNKRNDQGQLVIHLDLEPLDPTENQRLTAATPEEPVTLIVLMPPPPGRGAFACESSIQILKVE